MPAESRFSTPKHAGSGGSVPKRGQVTTALSLSESARIEGRFEPSIVHGEGSVCSHWRRKTGLCSFLFIPALARLDGRSSSGIVSPPTGFSHPSLSAFCPDHLDPGSFFPPHSFNFVSQLCPIGGVSRSDIDRRSTRAMACEANEVVALSSKHQQDESAEWQCADSDSERGGIGPIGPIRRIRLIGLIPGSREESHYPRFAAPSSLAIATGDGGSRGHRHITPQTPSQPYTIILLIFLSPIFLSAPKSYQSLRSNVRYCTASWI